jgi:hypothetical protein
MVNLLQDSVLLPVNRAVQESLSDKNFRLLRRRKSAENP